MAATRVVEMLDVTSEVAVRIVWMEDMEPEVRFLTLNKKSLHILPASVVRLAASVLNDPSTLERNAAPVERV
jgi:hypothetical protein